LLNTPIKTLCDVLDRLLEAEVEKSLPVFVDFHGGDSQRLYRRIFTNAYCAASTPTIDIRARNKWERKREKAKKSPCLV